MVRQLEEEGQTIDFAAILDAGVGEEARENDRFGEDEKELSIVSFICERFEKYNLVENPYPEWLLALRSDLLRLARKDVKPYVSKVLRARFPEEKHDFVLRAIELVVTNFFVPMASRGRVNSKLHLVKAAQNKSWHHVDDSLGWLEYAAEVEVILTPGDHKTMVMDQHARWLGECLKEKMEAARVANGV
jgi:thioesterase domain-containing protein